MNWFEQVRGYVAEAEIDTALEGIDSYLHAYRVDTQRGSMWVERMIHVRPRRPTISARPA
jgi:hypothetical protein